MSGFCEDLRCVSCKDPLLVAFLEYVDQPTLEVWVEKYVWLIKDQRLFAPISIEVNKEL